MLYARLTNEFYARDTSRKMRAVNKSKGEKGVPLTTNVPYGYFKDPEDKTKWLVDEEAAQVVKISMFSGLIYCADCGANTNI